MCSLHSCSTFDCSSAIFFLPVPFYSLGFSLCHISCELDWPVHQHLSPFPSNHVPSPHLLVVGVGTLSRFVRGLFVTTDRAFEVLCSSVFGCRNCVTGDTIAITYLLLASFSLTARSITMVN